MKQSTNGSKETNGGKETSRLKYKEIAVKYNLHINEAVALEAVAAATPLLMMKMPVAAIAGFVGAIVMGMSKDDKEKGNELQLAYDELVKETYRQLTETIKECLPEIVAIAIVERSEQKEEEPKDKSGLH